MNLEAVKLAAEANQWGAIFPELMLACLALALLVLEIALPKKLHAYIPDVALAGLVVYYDRHHKANPFGPVGMGLCLVGVYLVGGFAPDVDMGQGRRQCLAQLVAVVLDVHAQHVDVTQALRQGLGIGPMVAVGARHQAIEQGHHFIVGLGLRQQSPARAVIEKFEVLAQEGRHGGSWSSFATA